MSRSMWAALGIARTEDMAKIRRAYAARLKAIDVDAEPEAFVRLHEAFKAALDEARYGPLPDLDGENAPDDPGETEVSLAPGPPAAQAAADPTDIAFARLESLLFDDPEAMPDGDELVALVEEILARPEMARIDHAARVETWLAAIAYDAIPRADPIVPLLVHHFDWARDLGRIDQNFLFEELTQRDRALALLDRVADPSSDLHDAWLELHHSGGGARAVNFHSRSRVRRLLSLIRDHAPAAEAELDPARVAFWDDQLDRGWKWPGWQGWVGLIWLAFVVVRIIISIAHGS